MQQPPSRKQGSRRVARKSLQYVATAHKQNTVMTECTGSQTNYSTTLKDVWDMSIVKAKQGVERVDMKKPPNQNKMRQKKKKEART